MSATGLRAGFRVLRPNALHVPPCGRKPPGSSTGRLYAATGATWPCCGAGSLFTASFLCKHSCHHTCDIPSRPSGMRSPYNNNGQELSGSCPSQFCYFSFSPSRKAFPTASPTTRYTLKEGSKMIGFSFPRSTFPSVRMLSSAWEATISPIR